MRALFATCILLLFGTASAAMAATTIPTVLDDVAIDNWRTKERCYAEALNSVAGVKKAMGGYMEWAKDGPKPGAKRVAGIADISAYLEMAQSAAAENKSVEVSIPGMDVALSAAAEAAYALGGIAAETHAYYAGGAWRADNMAHGVKMHPELVARYEAFMAATSALDAANKEFVDAFEPAKLAHIAQKYGKEYYWQHVNIMDKARRVVAFVPDSVDDQVNGGAYGAALVALDEAAREFAAYYTNTGEETVGKMARSPMTPETFAPFLETARELGGDFNTAEKSVAAYVGRINGLVRAYNSLIEQSNATTFLVRK